MLQNYFKTAIRNLLRHKRYAAINIAGLALGLAACWMIVLYVADELSYDRNAANADRVYRVAQHASWDGGSYNLALTSAPFAPALKNTYPEIEEAVRVDREGGGMIEQGDKKLRVNDIIFTDNNFFKVFPPVFLYGDAASALANPASIVISESLAIKLFGSVANAVNQNIYFDNHEAEPVTAVIKDVPANSHLGFSAVRRLPDGFTEGWQNAHFYTYLLLKPSADYKTLEKKLPAFAENTIKKESGIRNYHLELQPLTSIHLHSNLEYEVSANGSISRVYIFMAIAALILLIAIINYMNLSTARSASRVREVGVRKAIGSGKKHLAGMFITESVLVTFIAAFIAVFLVQLLLPLFNQLTEKDLSIWRFGVINSLLLLIGFSIVTGIISGIYPSFFLARFKTIPALKGQMGNMAANILFRKSLVVFQFVITVVMIAGSIVIYRQLQYALHTDLGFNKDQVLSFHIDDRAVRSQMPALKQQLLKSPLIAGVSAAGNPIGNNDIGGDAYRFQNNDGSFADKAKMVQQLMADADYLGTMEIKLLGGRNFSEAMPTDKTESVLVNETLVKQLGWNNAIGRQLFEPVKGDAKPIVKTVVGVMKDFHIYSLQHTVEPLVIIMPPVDKEKDNLYVKIAKGKTTEALAYLNSVYRQFDKTAPVETHFLDQNFAKQYAAEEKQGTIALIFTILSVVIAGLGLFGLAAFTAEQRTKEIGIRKVLGASVTGIVQMLSKDFVQLVLLASVIAFPITWWAMSRWLQDFAYRINISWWIFLVAGFIAFLIALITVSIQAIKAAMANPVKSLRTE